MIKSHKTQFSTFEGVVCDTGGIYDENFSPDFSRETILTTRQGIFRYFLIFFFLVRNFKHAISNCEKMNLDKIVRFILCYSDALKLSQKPRFFNLSFFRQFSNFPASFLLLNVGEQRCDAVFVFNGLIFQLLILQLSSEFLFVFVEQRKNFHFYRD